MHLGLPSKKGQSSQYSKFKILPVYGSRAIIFRAFNMPNATSSNNFSHAPYAKCISHILLKIDPFTFYSYLLYTISLLVCI